MPFRTSNLCRSRKTLSLSGFCLVVCSVAMNVLDQFFGAFERIMLVGSYARSHGFALELF